MAGNPIDRIIKTTKCIHRIADLDGGSITETLPATFFDGEGTYTARSHMFIIELRQNGNTLHDYYGFHDSDVSATFVNAKNQTIEINNNRDSGSCAYIESAQDDDVDIAAIVVRLPPRCYHVEGYFTLTLSLRGTVVYELHSYVKRRSSDEGYDPTAVIHNMSELLALFDQMKAAENAANAAAEAASAVAENVDIDMVKSTGQATITITRADGTTESQVFHEVVDASYDYMKLSIDAARESMASGTGLTIDGKIIQLESGYYETVDNNPPRAMNHVDSVNFVCCKVPCQAGDVFTIHMNGRATGVTRPWGFYDSSGVKKGASTTAEYEGAVTAPTGSEFAVFNNELAHMSSGYYVVKGKIIANNVPMFRGNLTTETNIKSLQEIGWYRFTGMNASKMTGLPTNYTGTAGNIEVLQNVYGYINGRVLRLTDANGNTWFCLMRTDVDAYLDWTLVSGPIITSQFDSPLKGKKVAIIGDSISTNGVAGTNSNVPEIIVEEADVGVQLSAYLTYRDMYDTNGDPTGLSLGGRVFTASEIGTEVTFTPNSSDVGKKIGVPLNYNPNSTTVWWEVVAAALDFNPIPVCWSGSSITSHEKDNAMYKASYAWHDSQIRKCGIRTPGGMNRTAPDVIIIYRGTNDMTHTSYARLTNGYFDSYNWSYPETDEIADGYGYKEGLCLTIQKLRSTYPNAKIFLCTLNVFKRVNYSHFPTNNGINSLPQYNDAIREVADFMGCGLIEFDKDGITFENCYSEGYITDSATMPTHPSNKGHKAMGLKAIADLNAQYSAMS